MNRAFDKMISCIICEDFDWDNFSNVNHSKKSFSLKICKSCGFVSQNPPLSKSFLEDYYSNNYVSKNYNSHIENLHQRIFLDNIRINFLDDLGYRLKNEILEIGPGAGSMMKILSEKGAKVIGIEPDSHACNWLAKNTNLKVHNGFFETIYNNQKKNGKKIRLIL